MTGKTVPESEAAIGVFDSGVGGLSVVRRLRDRLPYERILYVADQAHVPYGGRELGEVCGFACGISEALLTEGCKAIVMACNISSATALPVLQAEMPHLPILGVILPGAQAAAARTRNGRVGVLATAGTVKSGAYTRALHGIAPALQVTEVACPAFVPLVEAGQEASSAATAAAQEYLAPLRAAGVDTVILGCTHYPFLLPVLTNLAPEWDFVDPAEQTARDLADHLAACGLLAPPRATPRHRLTTTGDPAEFAALLPRFLPDASQIADVDAARWENGALHLK
ncbi:MAG TPA: glutamate racemase [Chthonomonadaceae bacterium]|nr:glutamate racemase [Chthonomonadaceae bacterium]